MNFHGFHQALSTVCTIVALLLNVSQNKGAQTNVIYMPTEMETALGSRYENPFSGWYYRYEQVYSSNLFAHLPAETVILTEVSFRAEQERAVSVIPGALLALNVFQGSMEEIITRGTGYQLDAVRVFEGDIRWNAIRTNAFDLRFPLTTPFVGRRFGYRLRAVSFG
jgi:hypothetical protein